MNPIKKKISVSSFIEIRLGRHVVVAVGVAVDGADALHAGGFFGLKLMPLFLSFFRCVFFSLSFTYVSWCPYCQKVWLTLEEKKIPYRVEKVNMNCYGDKPAEFRRLQPSGQIPVAIIDGTVYRQSNDILQVLEEKFSNHKSLQPPKGQEARANQLLRLERAIFSAWLGWLTGSSNYKGNFVATLNEVERELTNVGPFFCGNDVTMVDFMYASFLERMAASLLYFKGFQIRAVPGQPTDYPAINRWFDAMETLPSYQLTKSDYYTHAWDLPPQLGGCNYEPGGEPYEKAINGEQSILNKERSSWSLPLEPHMGGIEPDWEWAMHGANREAVERVSANHQAIVKFAARGAGKPGIPPVSAPLADPNAQSNEAVQGAVDACFRVVMMAILTESTEQYNDKMQQLKSVMAQEGGKEYVQAVVDSLAYVRDRVGVPRDMKLPAARLLRAHLNWAIDHLVQI
jgi:glutathione S-transferase